MSCMAIVHHIQLLDMPSTRSSHAAAAGERSGGNGRLASMVCRSVMSPFMPVVWDDLARDGRSAAAAAERTLPRRLHRWQKKCRDGTLIDRLGIVRISRTNP